MQNICVFKMHIQYYFLLKYGFHFKDLKQKNAFIIIEKTNSFYRFLE
jgi:hypothetical protein